MAHRCPNPKSKHCRLGFTRVELLIVIILGLIVLSLSAVFLLRQREHSLRVQCENNLRRIGEGVQGYHEATKALPPARIADGYATWAVLLAPHVVANHPLQGWDEKLPFLGQDEKTRRTPLMPYFCPAQRRTTLVGDDGALGDFAAVSGDGDPKCPWTGPEANGPLIVGAVSQRKDDQILAWKSRTTFDSLKRGLSVTLLIGDKHVPMDHFGDVNQGDGSLYDGRQPEFSARVAGPGYGLADSPKAPFHDNFGSGHAFVCQFLNADGSVRAFVFGVDPKLLRRLTTRE